MNPFRAMTLGYRYHELHEKYMAAREACGDIQQVSNKLLQRSERFFNDCKSLEKQKGALQLRIRELEESHDHAHRRNQEAKIEDLENQVSKQQDLLLRQRDEIVQLKTANSNALAEILRLLEETGDLEVETFGVSVTHEKSS